MTYATIYAASNDAVFQGRCLVACWKAASDIINEDSGTANHAARAVWAERALQGRRGRALARSTLRW